MSEHDEPTTSDHEGLTKPLINNVGGVIDQDAPSADQLLNGQPDPSWDKTTVVEGDAGWHHEDDASVIPAGPGRSAPAGWDATDRAPGGGRAPERGPSAGEPADTTGQ